MAAGTQLRYWLAGSDGSRRSAQPRDWAGARGGALGNAPIGASVMYPHPQSALSADLPQGAFAAYRAIWSQLTLDPAAGGTLNLLTLTTTGTGTVTGPIKQVNLVRSIAGTGTPTVQKLISRLFSIAGTGTPAKFLLHPRSFVTTGTGSATSTRAAVFTVIRTVAGTGTVTLTRLVQKTFQAAGTGAAQVIRRISKIFSVGGTGTPTVTDELRLQLSFSVGGVGTPTSARVFIPGAPPPIPPFNPWFEGKSIFVLSSVAGLTPWVDYIPCAVQNSGRANSFDADGNWRTVKVLSSTAGLTAWVDYWPVFVVSGTISWSTDVGGFTPFDSTTPNFPP